MSKKRIITPFLFLCCFLPALSCQGEEEPDALFYPFYGTLSENEKAVYRQALDCASLGVTQLEPTVEITASEAGEVVNALFMDQPQLFWMTGAFECQYLPANLFHGEKVTSLTLSGNGLEQDWETSLAAFNDHTRDFLEGLNGFSPAEAEMEIHNRLVSGTDYVSGSSYNQSAYSAICLGESVCAGYTRAFQHLMISAGIPCYYCEGTATGNAYTGNSSWSDHAWNIVSLDGGFYNVDITWDDTILSDFGLTAYTYYNQPDTVFEQNHIRGESAARLPSCTDTEYAYESLYGMPAQLGILSQFQDEEIPIFTALDDYFAFTRDFMVSCGIGEYTARFVIYGDDCYRQMADSLNGSDFPYLQDVVYALGLNGYQFSVSQNCLQLGSQYYLVTQTTTLY